MLSFSVFLFIHETRYTWVIMELIYLSKEDEENRGLTVAVYPQ